MRVTPDFDFPANDRAPECSSNDLASPGAPPQREPATSFATLYTDWLADVSRWVTALGAPPADRDDLVQEVFLIAYRRLADFDGTNPSGWLYLIARRKVRDHLRLAWVKHFFGRKSVAPAAYTLTTHFGPFEALETKQQRQHCARIMSSLNEGQRAALVLFELEGRSGAEIAELSGVPINTVWQRLYTARKVLIRRSLRSPKPAAVRRAAQFRQQP